MRVVMHDYEGASIHIFPFPLFYSSDLHHSIPSITVNRFYHIQLCHSLNVCRNHPIVSCWLLLGPAIFARPVSVHLVSHYCGWACIQHVYNMFIQMLSVLWLLDHFYSSCCVWSLGLPLVCSAVTFCFANLPISYLTPSIMMGFIPKVVSWVDSYICPYDDVWDFP